MSPCEEVGWARISAVVWDFDEYGFVVVSQVFDQEAMRVLVEAVEDICERYRRGDESVRATGYSLSTYIEKFPNRSPGVPPLGLEDEPYLLGVLARHAPIKTFLEREELWLLAAALLRVEVARLAYHYAQVVRSPARVGPALGWHRDFGNPYISTDGAGFVRLLLPLRPMDEMNGGTGVVAGSHLVTDDQARTSGSEEHGPDAVYPACTAGDVLAMHSKAMHTRRVNRTDDDRDPLAVQFGRVDDPMLHVAPDDYLSMCTRPAFAAG